MVLRRVYLTGASGMLGSHYIKEFLKSNIEFVCSSRNNSSYFQNIDWFSWNLLKPLSPRELRKRTGKIDAIFHVGSHVPTSTEIINNNEIFEVNVKSAISLSEYALEEGIPICYISGATVYDKLLKTKIKEKDKTSVNGIGGFYGFSKLLTENVFEHFKEQGLKLTILRPSSIYGFGQHKTKLVIKFINNAIKGKTINLIGPFSEKINFIHASDVVLASLQIMKKNGNGIYNVADKKCYSVNEIANFCVKIIGSGDLKIKNYKSEKQKGIKIFNLNTNLIKKKFNFEPKMSIQKGISQTLKDIQMYE